MTIYHTIKQYREITGDSHTVTYEKIARGELIAVKNGGKTLIVNTAEHMSSWPRANITMPAYVAERRGRIRLDDADSETAE